jgi:hypothetical protein
MKKYFLTLLFTLVFTLAFSADIKVIEVSVQKFREIRKDLDKKGIAYYIDAGAIHAESFGKPPKEIVTYETKDENGLKQVLTTGSRP